MWINDLMNRANRRKAAITFDPHVFERKEYWNLDLVKIEQTAMLGKVFEDKCEQPNKLCFKMYFGKENITYTIIVRYHNNFIEVKTAWPKKGR